MVMTKTVMTIRLRRDLMGRFPLQECRLTTPLHFPWKVQFRLRRRFTATGRDQNVRSLTLLPKGDAPAFGVRLTGQFCWIRFLGFQAGISAFGGSRVV